MPMPIPPPTASLPQAGEIIFRRDKDLPKSEAAGTLELSRVATEAIHGTEREQL